MVAHTVYSEIGFDAWRDRLVQTPFVTDMDGLAESRELWNLLTLKLEMEVAMLAYLQRADGVGKELGMRLDAPEVR